MNERVRVAVQLAITRPVEDLRARIDILAALLDPAYATVERAIARFESGRRFPTTEREQIADYVIRAIERKVLAADSFPLTHLQTISPSAWVQSFARSCVPSGVTEVRCSRARASSSGSLEERITMPPAHHRPVAEDLANDPQLKARHHYWYLEHPYMGVRQYDGPAFRLSKTPAELTKAESGPLLSWDSNVMFCPEQLFGRL